MAVEEHQLTQSTQQSTQPTQDASQERSIVNAEIWGSLIPFNRANPYISRIDFVKTQTTYAIGRSRQSGVNDVPFPKCLKMSECFCLGTFSTLQSLTNASGSQAISTVR